MQFNHRITRGGRNSPALDSYVFKAPENVPEGEGAAPLREAPFRAAPAVTPLCTVLLELPVEPFGRSSEAEGAAPLRKLLDVPFCTAPCIP